MSVDTSRTIAIAGSPWKMLGLGLLGIGMTALSVAIAVPLLPEARVGLLGQVFGVVGALFFGACTLLTLWQALTMTGAVVTLTPTGIHDRRLASREIPWAAIRGISTWSSHGQKILVLAVDPAVEATLGLSKIARMSRGANRSLGADGLCISAQGLAMNYDDLLELAIAYASAHAGAARG